LIFTVPSLLALLALQNNKLIYTLLMRLSAETLIEVAGNPEHLGAGIGFFSLPRQQFVELIANLGQWRRLVDQDSSIINAAGHREIGISKASPFRN